MVEVMHQGGPIMVVLLVIGFLAIAIFLERLFQLHRAQIRWRDFLQGLFVILKRGNVAEAVSLCEEASGPVPMVIRAAILHHDEGAEQMREALHPDLYQRISDSYKKLEEFHAG